MEFLTFVSDFSDFLMTAVRSVHGYFLSTRVDTKEHLFQFSNQF